MIHESFFRAATSTRFQRLRVRARAVWEFFLELIFPKFCLGCKREGSFLCESCFETIPLRKKQSCPVCLNENLTDLVCEKCRRCDFFLDGVVTASTFEKKSFLQHAIHVFKYEFIEELAMPLGKILAKTWQQQNGQAIFAQEKGEDKTIIVCPVPIHPKRLRFRGFNQAELLARSFLEELRLLHREDLKENSEVQLSEVRPKVVQLKIVSLLRRTHFKKPQMQLSREERLTNVENVFELANLMADYSRDSPLQNATILLIDDVATTLSTLNNCAKVLKKAGAKNVFGLVLARVQLHSRAKF